jgi:type I restriction enzyme S subunit
VPEYIFGWLMSQYEHNRTVGAGGMQMALSATRVANLSMPICSQQEQHRVASLVSQAVSLIDREVTTVNSLLARAARLRQAILKRAFEGRLVPQDPADEPAAQLLERIRTARAAAGAGSPGPRRQGRQRQDRRPRQSRPPKPERLL